MDFSWPMVSAGTALAGFVIAWFFRSPKETYSEIERRLDQHRLDLDRRMTDLELRHTNLSVRFEGAHGKHDQALTSLTHAINRLTERFDTYMGTQNGRGHRP